MHMENMCEKPGKILSPMMSAAIYTPSTLSIESRKQSRWIMKGAIRRSADDMTGILDSGDKKATTFFISELERLLDYRTWLDVRQAQQSGNCRLDLSCLARRRQHGPSERGVRRQLPVGPELLGTACLARGWTVTCAQGQERYSHRQK